MRVRAVAVDLLLAAPHLIVTSLQPAWKLKRQARKAGVLGYLCKPYDPTHVFDVLQKV